MCICMYLFSLFILFVPTECCVCASMVGDGQPADPGFGEEESGVV